MNKPVLLFLMLLVFFGRLWADVTPPFSLDVVPSKSVDDGGAISMSHDKPQDFYVVLTNVSGESQIIWESWNSWGYQTISFEITTANGKKFVLSRGQQAFTRNFPGMFVIQPGEHQVYAVHLDKWWVSSPSFPKTDEMSITLRAVYQVSPTREASQHKVWIGRVESHAYKLMLRQW